MSQRKTNGAVPQGPGKGSVKSGKSSRRKRTAFGILAVIAAALFVLVSNRGAGAHPKPRPDASAEDVVHHSHYDAYPRIASVYRQAARVPQVLDGLHCYCECASHSGHYSLLDCFKSDHAASCDICLTEAALADDLSREGKSLDEVRDAVDQLYGR